MRGVISRSFSLSLILIIIVLLKYNIPLYGVESETSLKIEIVKDIVSYEESEPSLLARGKFSERIDDFFLFNASLLRDINRDSYDYCWNLRVTGLKNHLDITLGNYNMLFGSGLIMGKKVFITGDPFAQKFTLSRDEPVIPSTGTNPSGTFFGSAVNIYNSGDENSIGVVPFYSIQRRYISAEEIEQGYISASLATLAGRTERCSKYSQSVNIINYGGIFYFNWMDYLTFQGYGFKTGLKDSDGNDLMWGYSTNTGDGINGYSAAGMFIEYADDVVSFFIEPVFSSKDYNHNVTGKAMMWGCGVKNQIFLFTLRGKNCDPDFYSEYSSGGRNPENLLEINTKFKPSKKFQSGASFYSEKNLTPSYGEDYIEGKSKEEIYSVLKPIKGIEVGLKTARARNYSDDFKTEKIKFTSSLLLSHGERIFFRIKSDVQDDSGTKAYITACELKYLFMGSLTLSAGYTDIRVNEGSSIYAAIIPAPEADLSASLYKESAHGAALKLRYRKDTLSFHARGSVIQKGEDREMTAESSLSFIF